MKKMPGTITLSASMFASTRRLETLSRNLASSSSSCKTSQVKWGFFFYTMADCNVSYMSRIIPKVKPPFADPNMKVITNDIVLEMCSDILHSGRTITADRGFTAIDLAEMLHEQGLKYVGTIMRNRKGLPGAVHRVLLQARYACDVCILPCQKEEECAVGVN